MLSRYAVECVNIVWRVSVLSLKQEQKKKEIKLIYLSPNLVNGVAIHLHLSETRYKTFVRLPVVAV